MKNLQYWQKMRNKKSDENFCSDVFLMKCVCFFPTVNSPVTVLSFLPHSGCREASGSVHSGTNVLDHNVAHPVCELWQKVESLKIKCIFYKSKKKKERKFDVHFDTKITSISCCYQSSLNVLLMFFLKCCSSKVPQLFRVNVSVYVTPFSSSSVNEQNKERRNGAWNIYTVN